VLGIASTHRGDSSMAGFPCHTAESYISQILHSGYKIAIWDQINEPMLGQLVNHAIIQIITPGTLIASQHIEARDNNYILSF
jgi:DNA mismatch repair protein MutS